MKKFITLLLIVFCTSFLATAQNQEQALKNIITDANLPGLQLTYNNNGKANTYAIGVGKDNGSKPVTSATIFRAGSLGKCVFAYAVMKLYDRGIIALDTPLLHYMGSYDRFDAADTAFGKITARMVLSHTSGLSELEPTKEVKAKLLFNPGTSFAYSGEGIWFLQKVVEKILNKRFEQIMQEEVFIPLGMKHSTYVQTTAMDKEMLGTEQRNFAWLSPNAAFTLLTTSEDYARFLTALLAGKGLKQETQRQMFTRQTDAHMYNKPTSPADKYINWGLGIGLQQNEQGRAIWQWGNYGDDFYSFFIAYPDRQESLVFFTRGQSALKITNQVVNLVLGKQHLWAMNWLNIGYTYPETMTKLYDMLREGNWAHPAKVFDDMKRGGYQFAEADFNGYGYALLRQRKFTQAYIVFKQNINWFPKSSSAYDSYAEACMDAGNKALAIKNYRQSFALDSNNTNALFRIRSLTCKYALNQNLVKALAGKFAQKDNKDIFMLVSTIGYKLKLTDNEGGILELSQVAENEFYNFDLQMELKFVKSDNGKVNNAVINDVIQWVRVY